jgi:hypothetical protein
MRLCHKQISLKKIQPKTHTLQNVCTQHHTIRCSAALYLCAHVIFVPWRIILAMYPAFPDTKDNFPKPAGETATAISPKFAQNKKRNFHLFRLFSFCQIKKGSIFRSSPSEVSVRACICGMRMVCVCTCACVYVDVCFMCCILLVYMYVSYVYTYVCVCA